MMKRFSVYLVMALMAVLWGCEKKPVLVERVSLSETTLTLVEGETKVLTAEIAPADAENQSVTWSTSDKSVVTVEGGTVTAIKAGEATVTVTANDKGSVKAECKVTVTAAKVAVTGVSLDKTTLTVAAGGNAKLTATVAPANATNKSVTWSSSNQAIATVDSEGNVTVKSAGTATITVTTKDGGKTATCTVTVGIPVTGVSLNKTSLTLTKGKSAKLTATVAPANATNKNVTWSSSDRAVATVDSEGNVTANAAGTATITATTEDGNKTAECKVTVTEIDAIVGGWNVTSSEMKTRIGKNKWKSEKALIYKSFTFTNKAAAGELGWREVEYEDVRNVKVQGKYKEQDDKIVIKPIAAGAGSNLLILTEVRIENGTKLYCTIVNKEGTTKLDLEMEKASTLI